MGLLDDLYAQMRHSNALREAVTAAPPPTGAGPNPASGQNPAAPPPAAEEEVVEEPLIDQDDEIDSIDHPANHPAVHAAHAGFIITHDAMADDPTPENVQLFEDSWGNLKGALQTYVFGNQGGAEVGPDGQPIAVDPEAEGEEGEEIGGDDAEDDAETDETDDGVEEEAATPQGGEVEADSGSDDSGDDKEKKKMPFPKRESNPYIATNAQKHGVKGMNTAAYTNPHQLKIEYVSEDQTPWHINSGSTPISKHPTPEAAEHCLAELVAQAGKPMEMTGKEGNYTKSLIPDAPSAGNVSWNSVIGTQNQDFAPPNVAGPGIGGPWRGEPQPRKSESAAPSSGRVLDNPWAANNPTNYRDTSHDYQAGHQNMYGGQSPRSNLSESAPVLSNPWAGTGTAATGFNDTCPELAVPMHPTFANLPPQNVLAGNPSGMGGAPANSRASMAQFSESNSFMCSDTPSLMQLAAGYEYQPKDLNAYSNQRTSAQAPSLNQSQALQESSAAVESAPAPRLYEASCPNCSGHGCASCGQAGAVSNQEAAQMRESVEAAGAACGSHLMWSPKLPKQPFYGTYKPTQSKDPMVQAYDRINYARSRR